MDKWKAALTKVANLSGWDLQNVANGHESKFIESIIKRVLQEVNQTPLDVAWHPVGVDSRVEDIEMLLQSECEDEVRMVEADAFNGLVKLQEKLLHQILKTKDFEVKDVAEGVNLIKARLGSKKVLIILDDMDHISQLEYLTRERNWFGSGSLIIFTTRDEHLLCGLRENERYEAKLLIDYESLQLFSCHAFDSLSPPQEYIELARDVIKYSGGLPLALVTLGSHLRGTQIEKWTWEIKKLRAIPHKDIQKILQISFDGLDGDTQSVFLDIACAFHGFSKNDVTKILNACGFCSESAISTLVQRHLLQRDWRSLVMHDLVRDMGREIVRMESPRDPGKRSRLFNPQEVCDVLQGNKGSKKVEVLKVDRHALKSVNLSTKAFKKMKNLRVLKIDELHVSGDFELLSKELRWLSWKKCPLECIPSNFPTEKLVVLDMRESNIQEFSLNLQCCKSLKKLNLSGCKQLRRTPNFSGSHCLETLWFHDCSSLKEIHQSIGNLKRLIYLNLDGCKKLTDLPSSICQLDSLQILDISRCSSIQKLPVDFGDIQSLKFLWAYDTGIKQWPGSVEMLRNLETMNVGCRYLKAKRSFPGRRVHQIQGRIYLMRYLHLDLNDCENLQTLPPVSDLESLTSFEIANCKKLVNITRLEILPSIWKMNMLNCTLQNPLKEGFFGATALALQSRETSILIILSLSLSPSLSLAILIIFHLHLIKQGVEIYLQSNEIPDWCSNQVTASSLCLSMPRHNKEYKFLGMIIWCVHKIVKVRSSGPLSTFLGCRFGKLRTFLGYGLGERTPCVLTYGVGVKLHEHTEVSSVFYSTYNQVPLRGWVNGREKMKLFEQGEECRVKKIGIHLLYLDQHGNVTSLPGEVDQSYSQMKRNRETNDGVLVETDPQSNAMLDEIFNSLTEYPSSEC
ncbi:disease resistance protein RUN1-like [Lycium barbarum]|uniref:disease resistance protein RUN1-like n=1 Tax=Lycium barbarum TaxID=112863 RepID=UPI00293F21C0|nr:disease resistance protein RUN1-like [Lycium barbarum]